MPENVVGDVHVTAWGERWTYLGSRESGWVDCEIEPVGEGPSRHTVSTAVWRWITEGADRSVASKIIVAREPREESRELGQLRVLLAAAKRYRLQIIPGDDAEYELARELDYAIEAASATTNAERSSPKRGAA